MATTKIGKNISSLPTTTIQKVVGTKVDNNYGADTTAKVKAFQQANGLVADGIVGPKTQAAIVASMAKSSQSGSSSSSTNSIIENQKNLVSTSSAEKSKQSATSLKINEIINNLAGTTKLDSNGEYTYSSPITSQTDTTQKDTQIQEGNIKDSLGNTYNTSMPKDMTYQLPAIQNDQKWVFDKSGKPFVMDSKGTVTTNPVAEQEYNTNVQKNKDIETQNTLYDSLKKNVSEAHQVVIDSIKQKAQAQKTAMEDLNKRYLGAKTVAGFRTGATEYTPEIAMGILKNEEEEGIRRIQEIDDNMTLALAEAVSAKNKDELDVAQQKFDTYKKLQEAKEDAITNQLKMYIDNQKYIADANKALETEKRAKEDQSMQILDKTAQQYHDKYYSYTTQKAKDAYLDSLVTTLGLDRDTILSQIKEKNPKADKGDSASEIRNKQETNKKNDIAEAVLRLKAKIDAGATEIDAKELKFYQDFIMKEYGASAVLELNKALSDNDLLTTP
jgi:peptidoglycan hydrolase-like protein with peptidoglycan-binding domain